MRRPNRVFVKVDSQGKVTNQIRHAVTMPKYGKWIEIDADLCCPSTTTTSTTTTTTTTA